MGTEINRWLAAQLPDLPRWVEVRANLLWDECEVFGLVQEPILSCLIREPDTGTAFIVGQPSEATIRQFIRGQVRELIIPVEQREWLAAILPEWHTFRIILHQLNGFDQLPLAAAGQVDFLDADMLEAFALPVNLLGELQSGAAHSPLAVTFDAGQPVSFCYAGALTESLWDVSVDTLPGYRRKGYAALCVAHMIRYLHQLGKQPVWAALEGNPASWQLARKLGFGSVDELVLFESPQTITQGRGE